MWSEYHHLYCGCIASGPFVLIINQPTYFEGSARLAHVAMQVSYCHKSSSCWQERREGLYLHRTVCCVSQPALS